MFRILLLEWSHNFLIRIGSRFATGFALKLPRLLSKCYDFSSHPNCFSHPTICADASSFSSLSICVPSRKTTMATSKSFASVASNIWNALPNHLSSIPTFPVFRRALKHHLFLLVYPDSSAKSGMIKPAQCITRQLYCHCTTRKCQAAHLNAFHLSAYD